MTGEYDYMSKGSFGRNSVLAVSRSHHGVSISTTRFRFTLSEAEAIQLHESLGALLIDSPIPYSID